MNDFAIFDNKKLGEFHSVDSEVVTPMEFLNRPYMYRSRRTQMTENPKEMSRIYFAMGNFPRPQVGDLIGIGGKKQQIL